MTATFNYQNKKITVHFDPISSHVLVSSEDSVLKYIEVTDSLFGMIEFKNLVERMIQNLDIKPNYI